MDYPRGCRKFHDFPAWMALPVTSPKHNARCALCANERLYTGSKTRNAC